LLAFLSGLNTNFHRIDSKISVTRENLYQCVVYGEDQKDNNLKLRLKIMKVIIKGDTLPISIYADHYTYTLDNYLGMTLIIRGRLLTGKNPYQPNLLIGEIIKKDNTLSFSGKIFNTVSNYINKCIKDHIDENWSPIALGLILGGSSRLNLELKKIFSRAGVLHILAVSGLHIGFIITLLGIIFLPFPISCRIKFFFIMLFLLFYAGLTGFRPSVLRASLMAFLFGLSFILQRQVDPIHIVNMCALIILLFNPLILFDVGAQLSFSAVYGIVYLLPKINDYILKRIRRNFLKPIIISMATSFSAQLFVSPFLIHYFKQLPTLAIFSNLIVVPLASVIVYLLFFMIILSLIFDPLAHLVGLLINQMLWLLSHIAGLFASFSFSSLNITIPPIFLILFFLFSVKKMRRISLFMTPTLIIIFSLNSLIPVYTFKITECSTLITLPDREKILLYKGGKNPFEIFDLDAVDYLIASEMVLKPKKEFIPLPDRLYYKNIRIGDIQIFLDQKISIKYNDNEFTLTNPNPYNIRKWGILGQKGIYYFESPCGSIIDEILTDFKKQFGILRTNL
jgi:ComEC/Rec2-related protein